MKRIAHFVSSLPCRREDQRQHLYRLDPGGRLPEYVVVSATTPIPGAASGDPGGPETYIFQSDEEGKILNWNELPGSAQGDLDIHAALRRAGYEPSDVLN
jgi:hypothetical protein